MNVSSNYKRLKQCNNLLEKKINRQNKNGKNVSSLDVVEVVLYKVI